MGANKSCSKACAKCAADCARDGPGGLDDFDDEGRGGDPAGATFEETLEDLSSLDRHLMLFCATSNLSAVRWLLYLGAHWDACDANGTTCLHVACRAGALAIVREMMQYTDLLEDADAAGWTPLHIAVLMGRREVVVRLLQAGAPCTKRNAKGQMPAELCADSGTFEALRSFELHSRTAPGEPWSFATDAGPGEDIVGSRLQYEPFFVPRQAVLRSKQYKEEFLRIGTAMFNRQPGYGLAFLVASGATRDYPIDLSTFLRLSRVNIDMVGSFLGEAFSLSHTIRLEFVNSVALQDTGAVSALVRVFHRLRLPDDLQKINRVVHGVARIWWRQHERLLKAAEGGGGNSGNSPRKRRPTADRQAIEATAPVGCEELAGLELKQYLTSSDALHQLMFSSVLLHWYVHRDGRGPRREVEFSAWFRLNRGLETGGTDVPEHVQRRVFNVVTQSFIQELAVASPGSSSGASSAGPGDEGGGRGRGDEARTNAGHALPSALSGGNSAEGWAQIVGGGFPRPTGLPGAQTVTYRHMSNIFSEVTDSSTTRGLLGASASSPSSRDLPQAHTRPTASTSSPAPAPAPGAAGPGGASAVHQTHPGQGTLPAEPAIPGPRRDDFAWMTACCSLLFFSASPSSGAPYAFAELRKVAVASSSAETRVLTLVGKLGVEDEEASESGAPADGQGVEAPRPTTPTPPGGPDGAAAPVAPGTGPITIVLLLPDGRWQELALPKLELRVPTAIGLEMWRACISNPTPPISPAAVSTASGLRVATSRGQPSTPPRRPGRGASGSSPQPPQDRPRTPPTSGRSHADNERTESSSL